VPSARYVVHSCVHVGADVPPLEELLEELLDEDPPPDELLDPVDEPPEDDVLVELEEPVEDDDPVLEPFEPLDEVPLDVPKGLPPLDDRFPPLDPLPALLFEELELPPLLLDDPPDEVLPCPPDEVLPW
jgi:hypothetical protein